MFGTLNIFIISPKIKEVEFSNIYLQIQIFWAFEYGIVFENQRFSVESLINLRFVIKL